ncbi:hypothetical protein PR048_011638 [Dryococelus australis]|uniref:Uncharacterized protein n=1 Tax=Dryococelus australis TaxID=614101 RepID=A0ABQ9HMW6_9NEOP|nr:hypothetical protein PR048_011638 [Dryococelus australis]
MEEYIISCKVCMSARANHPKLDEVKWPERLVKGTHFFDYRRLIFKVGGGIPDEFLTYKCMYWQAKGALCQVHVAQNHRF